MPKIHIEGNYSGLDNRYLKLDQSISQGIINGKPNFVEGIGINSKQDGSFNTRLDINAGEDDMIIRYMNDGEFSISNIWKNEQDGDVADISLNTLLKTFKISTLGGPDYDLILGLGGKNSLKGDAASKDWNFYFDSAEDECPSLKVSGYKYGDMRRTVSQRVSDAVDGGYEFNNATKYIFDNGIYDYLSEETDAYVLRDAPNSTNAMRVDVENSKVLFDESNYGYKMGIGTDTPTEKLDVNGNARIRTQSTNGFATYTGSDGTLGVDTNTYLIKPVSRVRAYLDNSLSIDSDTWTYIPFDVENWDENNEHEGGIFTASADGFYDIKARTELNIKDEKLAVNSHFKIAIYKNGNLWSLGNKLQLASATFDDQSGDNVFLKNNTGVIVSDTIELAANDTIQIFVYQDSGGKLNVALDSTNTYFNIYMIKDL